LSSLERFGKDGLVSALRGSIYNASSSILVLFNISPSGDKEWMKKRILTYLKSPVEVDERPKSPKKKSQKRKKDEGEEEEEEEEKEEKEEGQEEGEEEIMLAENEKVDDKAKIVTINDGVNAVASHMETPYSNSDQSLASTVIEKNNPLTELEEVLRDHCKLDNTQIVPEKQVLLFLHSKYPEIGLNTKGSGKLDEFVSDSHKNENNNNKKIQGVALDETAFTFDLTKWKVDMLDEAMCHVFGEEVRHEYGYTVKFIEKRDFLQ